LTDFVVRPSINFRWAILRDARDGSEPSHAGWEMIVMGARCPKSGHLQRESPSICFDTVARLS
jgi:hypothetical protein